MQQLLTIVIIVIIIILIEFWIFHSKFDEDEREFHLQKLFIAILITIIIGIVVAMMFKGGKEDEREYGWFSKKKGKKVPPVAPAPGADRKYGGNPMKPPTYRIRQSNTPVDADKIYGGAAAAADPNRRPLNRRK